MSNNHADKFFIDQSVFENSTLMDVKNKELDLTWVYDANPRLHYYTELPMEKLAEKGEVDDKTISYKLNNYFYRSDDFTNIHNAKNHVLFAGCSETEGVGSNIDEVWSKIVYEKIKKDYDIDGFYSVARSGFGWQKVITNILVYIEKFGKPTHIFALLPNVARTYNWDLNNSNWEYVQNTSVWNPKTKLSEEEYKNFLIHFSISWNLFESYCKTNNINLIWSTWDMVDHQNIKTLDIFNNFLYMEEYVNDTFVPWVGEKRKDFKIRKYDLSRRDGHRGALFHEYWAEKFLNEIYNKGIMND